MDARAHGGERLAQTVRELAQLLDGSGVVAVHHLQCLHLQHQPGELVAHGVVDLARDARALGKRGGVGLVRTRVLKLAVLLAQVNDLVLEIVLQAVELALKPNGTPAPPREHHRARDQGEKDRRRGRGHTGRPRPRNAARRHHKHPARTNTGQVVACKRQRHPRPRHQRRQRACHAAHGRSGSRTAPMRQLEACPRANGNQQRHHAHGVHCTRQRHKRQAGEKHHALVGNSLHGRNYTDAWRAAAALAPSRQNP